MQKEAEVHDLYQRKGADDGFIVVGCLFAHVSPAR
jgi:hypothetical protein